MDNHDKVLIEVRPSEIKFWMDAMDSIVAFFEQRDQMNARVHMSEVRYSPITGAAMGLREVLGNLWADTQTALAKQ